MDNLHADLPPKMADGRNFTNWQPVAVINESLRQKDGIHTNWDYRKYLQENAESIRSFNLALAQRQVSNFPVMSLAPRPTNMSTETPYGMASSDLRNDFLAQKTPF